MKTAVKQEDSVIQSKWEQTDGFAISSPELSWNDGHKTSLLMLSCTIKQGVQNTVCMRATCICVR